MAFGKFELDNEEIPDFTIFVQSTSHNRVVLPDTKLIYRVKEEEEEAEEEEEDASPSKFHHLLYIQI